MRPGSNKRGQAGDLGQVGLHQLPQETQEFKIFENLIFQSSIDEPTASLILVHFNPSPSTSPQQGRKGQEGL